jgi:hypothetical protein
MIETKINARETGQFQQTSLCKYSAIGASIRPFRRKPKTKMQYTSHFQQNIQRSTSLAQGNLVGDKKYFEPVQLHRDKQVHHFVRY